MSFENELEYLSDNNLMCPLDHEISFYGSKEVCYNTEEFTNLDQEIASMIIMGFIGTGLSDSSTQKIIYYLQNNMLGGVILFGHNIESPKQLQTLTSAFNTAKHDAFTAVDQEGGKVQRLTSGKNFTGFPSASYVSEHYSVSDAKNLYRHMSAELAHNRLNLNVAPVVDITNPAQPCSVIGEIGRSFGSNPSTVIEYANAFIEAHHDNKIYTTIKHFPGHGLARGDSHLGLVDVTETAKPEELTPFYDLIERNKVDMIMTAHIVNKKLDLHYPATLSPTVLKTLLRDKGYDGIIVSDDLHMGAIIEHYSFEDSVRLAIQAGCDIMVFSNNPLACKNMPDFKPDYDIPLKVVRIVKDAIEAGTLSPERIHKSYNRIKLLQSKFT